MSKRTTRSATAKPDGGAGAARHSSIAGRLAMLVLGVIGLGSAGAAASVLVGSAPAGATSPALCYWTGANHATDTNWSDGSNWNCDTDATSATPDAGDSFSASGVLTDGDSGDDIPVAESPPAGSWIVFPSAPSSTTVTWDASMSSITYNSITIESGSYTFTNSAPTATITLTPTTAAAGCGSFTTIGLCESAGATPSFTVDLVVGESEEFAAAFGASLQVGGTITSTGGQTITLGDAANDGQFTLSADNSATLAGPLVAGGGVVLVQSAGALGANTNTVTVNATGELWFNSSAAFANAIVDDGDLMSAGSSSPTLSGPVTGTGTVQTGSGGTFTLSGTNSYSGGTTVDTGTLDTSTSSGLGSGTVTVGGSGTLALSGGSAQPSNTLDLAGTLEDVSGGDQWGGPITLASAASPQIANPGGAGGDFVVGGAISGGTGSTLTFTAAGFVDLGHNGGNSYVADTSVAAGDVIGEANGAFGSGTVTVASGAGVELGFGASADNALSVAGTGPGPSVGALATVQGSSTWSGPVTLTGDATFSSDGSSDTLTVSQPIGGSFALATEGPNGTVVISGANTYTGGTTVSSGTLQVQGGPSALGTGPVTVGAAGDLQLDQVDISLPLHLAGTLEGVGTACGDDWGGTITLTAATAAIEDTNTGCDLVVGGAIGGGYAPTFSAANGYAIDLQSLTGDSFVGATVTSGIVAADHTDALGTSGTVTVDPGAAVYLNTPTPAGSGVTVSIAGAGPSGVGAFVGNATPATWAGPVQLSAAATVATISGGETLAITDGVSGAGPLTIAGPGAVDLAGTSTYSAGTSVTSGSLVEQSAASFPSGTSLTVDAGTFDLGGHDTSVDSLSGSGGVVVSSSAPATLTDTAGTTSFAGTVTDQVVGSKTIGLTVSGADLTLTGPGMYSGGTTVTGGTLVEGAPGAFPASTPLVVDGGTFDLDGHLITAASVSGTGGAVVNNGTADAVLTDSAGTTTYGGTLEDHTTGTKTLGLAVDGAALTLTGTSTYSGGTTVTAGTLEDSSAANFPNSALGTGTVTVAAGGTLELALPSGHYVPNALALNGGELVNAPSSANSGWSGPVVLGADSTIADTNSSLVLTGVISGPSGFTAGRGSATGTVVLDPLLGGSCAPNAYAGTAVIADGTVEIYCAGALSASPVTVDAGATLDVALGGAGTVANVVTDDGTVSVAAPASSVVKLSGAISGSGALGTTGSAGSGIVDLTAADGYGGPTTVSTGALDVAGTLSASAVAVDAGATLEGTGTIDTLSSNAGTVVPGSPSTPGLLHASGAVDLGGTGAFDVQVAGASPGSGYTQLSASSTVSLAGAALEVTDGFAAPFDTVYTIVTSSAGGTAVSGTFGGDPAGTVVTTAGGRKLEVGYTADTVTLTDVTNPPPAPTVTALDPGGGPTVGGTSVTLTGTNLSGASAVDFGAVPAASFGCSATTCTALSPPESSGTVDVTVTTLGGTSATSSADRFTYGSSATTRTPDGKGYWLVGADGGVFAFGDAGFFGSLGARPLDAPVVAVATTPDGKGYWLVGADGGVFAFGDAGFFGSLGARPLNRPVVAVATTPDGKGYWLVGADGGVFAFGDAGFFGSLGGRPLNRPVVAVATTPDGKGYWLVGADGGVFAFGDAGFFGSLGARPLDAPVVAVATTPDGKGYWLVGADGGVFAFGDAGFFGTLGARPLNRPVVAVATTPDGKGYWLVGADGGVFTFGDAGFFGSLGGRPLQSPIVGG